MRNPDQIRLNEVLRSPGNQTDVCSTSGMRKKRGSDSRRLVTLISWKCLSKSGASCLGAESSQGTLNTHAGHKRQENIIKALMKT